jgi:signal transduction histidine kinase
MESDLADFVGDFARSQVLQSDAGIAPVHFEVPTEPLPVRIDSMMLKRGLDNLVRNAQQAVQADDAPQVVVSARREGDRAVLEVRDNGKGISPRNRARVFDPYFTTKTEGTGLGLAIVKKVVLEHQGEIVCDEAPEGGASFRITLPIMEPRTG